MEGAAKATPVDTDRSSATLFLEDTVSIQLHGGEPIVGVIVKSWHDLDEQELWPEVEASIPGDRATQSEFKTFVRTGQPPRQLYLFAPSSPENLPVLVHEDECTLLDRAFGFGDVVKRSLSDPRSGTIVAIDTNVDVRQFYVDPFKHAADDSDLGSAIENVPELELKLVSDWNTGDFVIYKNCWMGVLDGIQEAVTIKLSNGSVVSVYDPLDLEVPVSSTEEYVNGPSGSRKQRPRTVAPPEALSPGHVVMITKANLSRGRWIYGTYDPSVAPLGNKPASNHHVLTQPVDVKILRFDLDDYPERGDRRVICAINPPSS